MLNVAVVEDNDELRDAMVDTLRGRGHRAIGMDSAEAMTDQASGEPIDIVVVDVNLPGEDGFSLTRRLRAIQPRTGIIVVTGRNRGSDRKVGFEGGADIFLSKPISTEEQTAAVASLERRLDLDNGPGESKHANIGISLPGTGETPAAPVFIDGEKVATLRGADVAEQFKVMVADYIEKKFGQGQKSAAE